MANGKRVTVRVDGDKCQGHGRCKALAPNLFKLDEFGNSHVLGEGRVPDGEIEQAHLARANCPEMAVEIIEE